MPPYLPDLRYLDLTSEEKTLFGQFRNHSLSGAIVKNTGFPDNADILNLDPQSPYGLYHLPGGPEFAPIGIPGHHYAYYATIDGRPIDEAGVKKYILTKVGQLIKLFGFKPLKTKASFAAFSYHSPYQMHVTADAIKNGFYRKLVALQGKKRTWWTGATFVTHDSSRIWNYTECQVIPHLLR
jgi:hypothetical protein